MARKRRKKKSEEEIVEEEIIIDVPPRVIPVRSVIESPPPPKTKKIKYLGVDVLITRGPVTGERYRFTAKDRISEVAIEDYEGLLGKASHAHRCCGRKAGDPGRTVSGHSYFGPV